MNEPIWRPSAERVRRANLTAFLKYVEDRWNVSLGNASALYRWSCDHVESFWTSIWDFCDVIGDSGGTVLQDGDRMPGATFFPDGRLNFAENLLRGAALGSRREDSADSADSGGSGEGDQAHGDAIVFWGEDAVRRRLSWEQLRDRTARLARVLSDHGVGEGDRVAAFLPNIPEAIVGMLATASLGAVWSSSSPDFGVDGVLDRFGQIEPKALLCADGYFYKAKWIDSLERVARFAARLPSLDVVLVAGYAGDDVDVGALQEALPGVEVGSLERMLHDIGPAPLPFSRLPFNHPLYILFSSGTTGPPKCIVHGAGGTLLKHLYEHRLMCDMRPGDRVFYFTTCGWMMWNWLASGLASGATLLLYDGNPFWPTPTVLFDYADAEGMTFFGTSAKYIDALGNQLGAGAGPRETHRLETLRTMASTGSPLAPEGFDYVYGHIKSDVCLSSIAGGTDIVGCFVGGNPIGPVWRGEIQSRSLGMAVDVFDDEGASLRGEKGELVCTRPFPSMPIEFWNDPDGSRYRAAYFERYPGIWHHGDFIELVSHEEHAAGAGVIIHGRSDATLNPGGVRIGTAEIYRQVELLPEVEEAIAIGQEWDDDVRIVLFVKLAVADASLDDALVGKIKRAIRDGCSPRYVPAVVVEVADIPRTKSGKIVELAVREVVHGRPVKNREALANPEALEYFAGRHELQNAAL